MRSLIWCICFPLLLLLETAPLILFAQPNGCSSIPPVMYLNLGPIYKDARNSIPDTAMERRNTEQSDGVTKFMSYVEKGLEDIAVGGDTTMLSCAYRIFGSWAEAQALTEQSQHYNLQGTVKVSQVLIGLDLIALKFRSIGYPLSKAMVSWLHTLNNQNMYFFRHATNRGNLYVWSGAAAALSALIDHDPESLQYQDYVWRDALSKINNDGTIDGEMARGQRALIYHMYSFSAMLVLRDAREALSYPHSDTSEIRIRLLANMIGRALCDPGGMSITAKATQEIPGDWGYRALVGFGKDLLNDNWSRCGKLQISLFDSGMGGDTGRSGALLKQLALKTGNHVAPR